MQDAKSNPSEEALINVKSLSPTKISIIIVLVTIILMAGITSFIYFREAKNEFEAQAESETNRVEVMQGFVNTMLSAVEMDLKVAARQEELREYFETDNPRHLQDIAKEYLEVSETMGIYDQIRYLDEDGLEVVRINYNAGRPSIVAKDNLQNKKDRYYFSDTFSLDEGEIFVSPFDLNIEHGEIEQPLKPMIRFGLPLFDATGERRGIILINYLGNQLLEGMDRWYLQEDGELLMFNQDGFWIKGATSEDEWGFMYEDRKEKIVEATFPEEWEEMNKAKSGQFETSKGLFTYTKIFPLKQGQISSTGSSKAYAESAHEVAIDEYSWTIVSRLPVTALASGAKSLLKQIILVDLLLFIIVIFITWRLHLAITARKEAEKTIINLYELIKIINKTLRHDILGKLSGVRGALELSELIDKDENIGDAYENILSGIKLINQMRELEQSATDHVDLKKIDLRAILKEIASEQKMTVNVEGDAELFADDALKSVFENLIRNAKIHGGAKSVNVSIEEDGEKTIISIKDEGSGVEEDEKEKIFEEGFTSGETGNTGLGLYIVKKTIERYGGTISLEHNQPKGCNFIIELPKNKV